MKPATALKRVRREYRLVLDGDSWMVLDSTNSGSGIYGDEAAGQRHYQKTLMFRALELIDPEYDWHDFDWHTLDGTAEERVAKMLEWRSEQDEAVRQADPFLALVNAVIGAAHRNGR